MYQVEKTDEFEMWLEGLRDRRAKVKIAARLLRIEAGLLSDWKTLGDGVSEIRIDYGAGYRLYFTLRRQVIVIMLCGSDKSDQKRAIALAKILATGI